MPLSALEPIKLNVFPNTLIYICGTKLGRIVGHYSVLTTSRHENTDEQNEHIYFLNKLYNNNNYIKSKLNNSLHWLTGVAKQEPVSNNNTNNK